MDESGTADHDEALLSEFTADKKQVNAVLFRRVLALTRLTIPMTPPTMMFMAAMFWTSSSHLGLVLWVLAGVVGSVLMWFTLSPDGESNEETKERRLFLVSVGVGVLWGSLPIVAMPIDASWQLLMGIFLMGILAANVLATGGHRLSFLAFHVTVTVMWVLAYGVSATGTARWSALVFAYAGPIGAIMARYGHSIDRLAAAMTIRNAVLVDQLRVVNEQLEYRAKTDSLTDLANKASFNDYLDAIVHVANETRQRVAVLFLDLDRFKAINDGLGHAAGDELLRAVAGRITAAVPEDAFVSRLGGDELAVCLPDVGDIFAAVSVGDAIVKALETPFTIDGNSLAISTSVGVALTSREWTQADDLLRFADMALYRAKARGGSCVEVHDPSVMDERAELVDAPRLRAALEQREFVPYFQPLVSLESGTTMGYEALIRWVHANGVSVASAFMPSLVTSGLFPLLTGTIYNQILEAREQHPEVFGDLPISINIPAAYLSSFAEHAAERDRGLEGIVVEVSTSGLPVDPKRVAESLEKVHALGARTCLEDVGPGTASLSMIAGLGVDVIKLDRSIVQGLTNDFRDRAVAASVAELAQRLGVMSVAAGLETTAQVDEAKRLGYVAGQGWVFSPAIPASHLDELESCSVFEVGRRSEA